MGDASPTLDRIGVTAGSPYFSVTKPSIAHGFAPVSLTVVPRDIILPEPKKPCGDA